MDCLVEDYESLIPAIQDCPDPNDRHVVAAAIKGRCSAIITFNQRHFPPALLKQYDLESIHPDEFIYHQFGLDRAEVISATRRCRMRLKIPGLPPEEYLRSLERQALPKTVAELAKYKTVI